MREVSLSPGPWRFRDATAGGPWREAVVPGCVHADLLRHGLIPDPFAGCNELGLRWIEERDWEYATTFSAPAGLLDEDRVDLVADGLDTVAAATLNGREVGRAENMFVRHRWDVTGLLRPGSNELSIRFGSAMAYIRSRRLGHRPREFNDPVGRSQVIRKQACQFGWDWAPRLVTAGIWRDLRLEAWSRNRLEALRVRQLRGPDGSVTLRLSPELERAEPGVRCRYRLELGGIVVAKGNGRRIRVRYPQLWWPNGHGAQPLYTLAVEVCRTGGEPIGRWVRKIGLRTIELDRGGDRHGRAFRFVVNGRPLFAKGANWVPAHSLVAGLVREDYARDLRSAACAHMNMIRVWGGGVYESDDFYDLCDELGLLVWQDFMFACAIYPADAAFLRSVRTEAVQQVRRLRHRACLALWSGNNEIETLNADLLRRRRLRRDYDLLFRRTLARAVAEADGATAYWPSSPHRPRGGRGPEAGERGGDTHFWRVWHDRYPVKEYERWRFRFVSEFGMQSYSSAETNATFRRADEGNVFGPEMENHQKGRGGNQVILDYVSRRYRFPKSQRDLIYLSQLNQAHCMQVGVEHWRRNMPRCMGALYWQLNDCWPCASWSSIEFTGRWRALHFLARRFFAPVLVAAHVPGEEETGIGNYRRSTVREVHLYTVCDAPAGASGVLRWDLYRVDGHIVLSGRKAVRLGYGESVNQRTLDLEKPLAEHGRDNLVLRVALEVGGSRVAEESVFLTLPRFVRLPKAAARVRIEETGPRRARLTFASPVFQHRFAFELPGIAHRASDNFFELFPGESKAVDLELSRPQTAVQLRRTLSWHSLVDTY